MSKSNSPPVEGRHDTEFTALFEANFADVWRFLRRRCSSGQDADDVTAETFAIAWRRRDAIPADGARPWLFGVARKVLANQRRRNQRHEELRVRLIESPASSAPDDHSLDTSQSIREALDHLLPEERELLIMQAWDGLSLKEMAQILGCTVNAVSLRLFKARRKLADELERGPELQLAQKEVEELRQAVSRSLRTEGGAS